MISFELTVDHDPYLSISTTAMDTLVTVTAVAGSMAPPADDHAVVILIDASGSMDYPRVKLPAAKRAASKAVETLRDGTYFAVVAGTGTATPLYPDSRELAIASPGSRQAAIEAVATLRSNGGTAIGRWLTLADELLRNAPAAIRQAILLTDGRNEHESPEEFMRALRACEGHFRCDCRGIGEGWVAEELATIASMLLGTALDVPQPADLEADFLAIARDATSRVLAEILLQIWVPYGARLRSVTQTHPTIEELTGRARRVDDQTTAFPTGAWGTEKREYQVRIEGLDPVIEDEASWAGRIDLVRADRELATAPVYARWTADYSLYSQASHTMTTSRRQIDVAQKIKAGTQALLADDLTAARDLLGRAVALAHAAGDLAALELLARLVTIDDPATGTVVLRDDVQDHDVQVAMLRAGWTRGIDSAN
ncbi:VWA domain-containing protein [Frankia sp. CiP3]|uniref:vWA domain-containing protein n=1 Tax=Frankia sp. CiP3 TaxID=2880971 RepID=UPI001EF500B1|nr:VWA domain-containing protein [Frankia sp. CiP3]